MIQGHYGPAGLIHFLFQDVSFVWLMISTQVIDIVFFTFVLCCKYVCGMNIESCLHPWACSEYSSHNVVLMKDNKAVPFNAQNDQSHSLSGALIWTLIYTILYVIVRGRNSTKRSFVSLYAIFFLSISSHWVLDVVVRRHDVAVFPPFTTNKIGFGTWEHWSKKSNYLTEVGLAFAGWFFFFLVRKSSRLTIGFWISSILFFVMTLGLMYGVYFAVDYSKLAESTIDGSPTSPDQIPFTLLTYVLVGFLSFFMNRIPTPEKQKDQ